MKLQKWFETWELTGLSIKLPILEMEWSPADADKDAAWDMYVELLTRIGSQPLDDRAGVEKTALESIYRLFGLTRETIKAHGRDCIGFTRVAVIILNQVIRPFTAKWHRLSEQGAFDDPARCAEFREELRALRNKLVNYTGMLAEIAGVEDLSRTTESSLAPVGGQGA